MKMENLTISSIRKLAKDAGKELIFNRLLGGYQIKTGFNASEVEYPGRDEKGKLYLDDNQLKKLISYI